MLNKRLTFKIILFLIASDLLETAAQYCFKRTAMSGSDFFITNFSDALFFLKTCLLSPFIWLAFVMIFLTFIIWSTILSKIDLSVAVPVASFSYILVPLTSIFFLHEKVTMLDWTGILFILTGVIFVCTSTEKGATG